MTHTNISIPSHDDCFRENFAEPQAAASLVRLAAPPEVVELLDLDQMVPLPTTQFDPDMGKRIPDLLFECPSRAGRIVVSILFEHKSSPDYQIARQLLRYILLDYEQRQNSTNEKHALVLPILVYHGARRWTPNLSLIHERLVPAPLKPYILRVPAFIIDLGKISDDELECSPLLDDQSRATLLALKHIFQDQPRHLEFLQRLIQRVYRLPGEKRAHFLERTVLYLVYTGRVQRSMLQPFLDENEEEIPMRYKTGHQLDLEDAFHKGEVAGMEKGMELGVGTGISKGEDLKTIQLIERMLAKGFTWEAIAEITLVDEAGFGAMRVRTDAPSQL